MRRRKTVTIREYMFIVQWRRDSEDRSMNFTGHEERFMRNNTQQPGLAEMLEEPVVQLVMERDGVSREELETLIAEVGARYAGLPASESQRD